MLARRSDRAGAAPRRASARSTSSTDSSRGAPTERNKNSPRVFARPRTRWLLRINARETSRISKTRRRRRRVFGVFKPPRRDHRSRRRLLRRSPRTWIHRKRVGFTFHASTRGEVPLTVFIVSRRRLSAQNAADALRDDYLEVTIRPGAPSRLDFDSSRLPLTHDVNVTFPPFTAVARDVSGNAIQSFPTSAVSVSVSPPRFASSATSSPSSTASPLSPNSQSSVDAASRTSSPFVWRTHPSTRRAR